MNEELTLEGVAARVAEWRQTRGRLISKEIWLDVERLCRKHPIREVSRVVKMPPTTLYRRLRVKETTFCELPKPQVLFEAQDSSSVIEIKKDDGREFRIRYSCRADLESIFAPLFN